MRHRLAAAVLTVVAAVSLAGCGDDEDPPAAAPAPVSSAPQPGGSLRTESGEATAPPAQVDRPEIVTNPDGTVNSGGPRPATRDDAVTAGGIGPYRIGVSSEDLAEAKLIGPVTASKSQNCPGYAGAKGVKRYGTPTLTFYRGRLLRLTVAGDSVATDKGVKVGTPMADVQRRYPDGKPLSDWTGRDAWFHTVGDYGLLFPMDGERVASIQAGMAEPMHFKHTDNQGC